MIIQTANQFSAARAASKWAARAGLVWLLGILCCPLGAAGAVTPQLGAKKIIVMLVDFPDAPGSTPPAPTVSNAMLAVSSFYQSNSFNQLSLASTVIGPLRMPSPSSNYVSGFNVNSLRNDALTAARASGCEPNDFDYDIVTFTNIGFSFAGWGTVGGRGLWVQNLPGTILFNDEVTAHEFGHNLGLGHAHAWISPTVTGAGASADTGNLFDAMGSGLAPSCHFNSNLKFFLGWLPADGIHHVTSNGVYRIYAIDGCGPLDSRRQYSLVVPAAVPTPGDSEDYWVECRQLIENASLNNGIIVMWGNTTATYRSYALDTTPGSQAGILDMADSPVTIGRSFTDVNKRITITPLAKGGTGAGTYFDVQVVLDSTAIPPAILVQPGGQSVPAGSNVVLSVTGTSSSPINYQWQRYGANIVNATNSQLPFTNVSAAQAADYRVVLSNSLGSVASSTVTLIVTYPPPPACSPIPPGVVAWWPGDGHPLDWIGTNHAVLQGAAAYAQGKVGQGFALNGATDFVQVPNPPAWAFGSHDFTIELWALFSVVDTDCAFVADDDGGGQQNKWMFWWNDRQLRFYALNANSSVANVGTANFSPATNQWYHLAVTRAGSTFVFYINGAAVSTNTSTIVVPSTTAPLTIGEAEGAFFFGGVLDEVRIYSRGLSGAEMLDIFRSGSTGLCWSANAPSLIEFSNPATSAQEGSGSASLELRRLGNISTSVSVRCISSNGTALAGVNYLPVSSPITFSPNASNKTVNLSILKDGLAGGIKQLTVRLGAPSSNAVIGAQCLETVTIVDSGCLPRRRVWWPGGPRMEPLGIM